MLIDADECWRLAALAVEAAPNRGDPLHPLALYTAQQQQKQEVTAKAAEDLSAFSPDTSAEMIPALDMALTARVSREQLDKAWEKKELNLQMSQFKEHVANIFRQLDMLDHAGLVKAMLTSRWKPCTARHLCALQRHFLVRGQRGFAKDWATQLGADGDRAETIAVDRRFLAGEGSRMVLLHDYRDLKFLQRISAVALFGTLMSSSGLAYALALTWPVERCLMLAFQMVGVPLVIFLDQLRPGHALEGGFIKFRLEGSAWDMSRWIWFRMPRGAHGTDTVRPGKQVGNRPVQRSAQAVEKSSTTVEQPGDGRRHFLGAGLGVAGGPDRPEFAAPRAPQIRQTPEQVTPQGPRRVLQALRLQDGLPASSQATFHGIGLGQEGQEGILSEVSSAMMPSVKLEIHEWQAEKTRLSKRRPSVALLQDLEDAPVVAAPSEEEVAMAWRPKENASGSSSSENFLTRGDPESQGRWTVPPRLPSVDRATPPRTPPRNDAEVVEKEEVEARDFRSNELRPHVMRSSSGPRAASVGHRYSPSPRPKSEDLPCYGLDAELKAKAAAKYSHAAEEAAATWVQAVTGHHFQVDFGTTLRQRSPGSALQCLHCT
eukprot:s1206_g16.t2